MTMQILEPEHYHRARPLFERLEIHLAVRAILEGTVDALIYVDDPRAPRVAFTRTGHRFYLVGTPDNAAFNAALRHHLLDTVYPAAKAAGDLMFVLYYVPDAWAAAVPDLLRDKAPMPDMRHYYEFQGPCSDLQIHLPDGFTLHPVDQNLLSNTNLENIEALREELCSERASVDEFLEKSFGVCVRHGDILVGWCLSEYNSGDRCEVGIETVEGYRRRGLATTMTAALIEVAFARGVTRIGWHCWASNTGSVATARSAGFELVSEYPVFFAYFDEALNLAINGNMCFVEEQYSEALAWLQRALDLGADQAWIHWRAACAAARLEQHDLALRYLGAAVDAAFVDLERLRTSPHLVTLHELPAWQALVRRVVETAG